MKRSTLIAGVFTMIVSVILGIGFGVLYLDDYAWGAWGDDSPGYTFLAGQMLRSESNVYQDALAARGLEFFGDEKLARWLTPTHHQFINTRGVLASKYPVGLSLLMYWAATVLSNDEAIYLVVPIFSAVNIVLVYMLGLLLFHHYRYRQLVSIIAASTMGVSNLYYDYAIAQPMREIPSMTFLLIAVFALVSAVEWWNHHQKTCGKHESTAQYHTYFLHWQFITFIIISAASFAMAFNIRETSLALLPVLALYVLWSLWDPVTSWKANSKRLWAPVVICIVVMIAASTPTIKNSYNISKEKEVFKERDTSNVVVLSNIGHIKTLSPTNIFNNEGKFRPGKGALPHYWDILRNAVSIPYFLLAIAVGMWYYWRESHQRTILLIGWMLSVLILFSMWINPYSRYILPLFPPLFLLGLYGIGRIIDTLLPLIFKSTITARCLGIIILLTGIAAYQPVVAQVQTNLTTEVYRFKAISRDDLLALKNLASIIITATNEDTIKNSTDNGSTSVLNKKPPVLLFSGAWQYGISETMQTHTGIKTIRFPLEQRFLFNRSEVQRFFDEVLTAEYTVYVWADTTSSVDFYEWLSLYTTELVESHTYTFEPDVRIYRIVNKK